jgi:hypothetical protein
MKKFLLFFPMVILLTEFVPLSGHSQGPPDFPVILKLINIDSPGEPRYYEGDVTDADRRGMDLNGDGISEWAITPRQTGCGETGNCSFYILAADKKKWKLILKGEGKVTNLTPAGFVVAPRKTLGYADILDVWDQGPEGDGTRSLEYRAYIFNGKIYERRDEAYPPADASPELSSLLKQMQQLKYQRGVQMRIPRE